MTKTFVLIPFFALVLSGCEQKANSPIWEIVSGAGQDARLLLEKTTGCVWSIAPQKQTVDPNDLGKLPEGQARDLVKGMNDYDDAAGRLGRFELVPVKGIEAPACEQLLKKGRT